MEVVNNDVMNEHQNEVIGLLCKSFMDHYNACPAFFIGSLQNACESAFNSTVIKERRPLLVYIHHNKSLSSNIFCSEIIIDYFLENYIIWPWDITYEYNKDILIKIWEEIFSNKFIIDFSMEKCPMLIGIMRRSSRENNLFSTSQYEFKVLLQGDILMYTYRKLDLETLLDQLVSFKEKFDENEQNLSFNFVEKTGLCWEIILDIVPYLSLNDTVTTFSTDIIPLLDKHNIKLPIIEPSIEFMTTMIEKIDHKQIVSLRLKPAHLSSILELAYSVIFTNTISLTLINPQQINQVNELKICFPKLICLSFCYDNEVDVYNLYKLSKQIEIPIKRFEIHCCSTLCSHRNINNLLSKMNKINYTVEYFLLDVAHMPTTIINNCYQYYNTCFLMTIIDFIEFMPNIRYIRIIINKSNIGKLFDVKAWKNLIIKRHQLEKVTLQVNKNISQDTQLIEKILEIQKELFNVRQTIKFEMKSK